MFINAPPKIGPITVATLITIPFIPSAFPSSFLGNASATIGVLFARSNEPPIDWTNLNKSSCHPVVENPHKTEPIVKTMKPLI